MPPNVSDKLALILAEAEYKPETIQNGLQGWKKVVEHVSKDQGTQVYVVGQEDDGKHVRTVEIFESWDFVKNTYLESAVVKETREKDKEFRVGELKPVTVRVIDGFLGRERTASKL